MTVELDLRPAADWFRDNLPYSFWAVAAAWYWVVGQAVRVAYRRRRKWFCCRHCRPEGCPQAPGNAAMLWVLSPFVPAILVAWTALWAVSLAAVPPPWKFLRSDK